MTKDAIYSEVYKGHTIEIFQDLDGGDSPDEWGDNGLFLVHYHRDFQVTRDSVITEDDVRRWYQGEKIAQAKQYHIFAVSAYIHSDVVLSLENTFPSDSYGWDTSHVGIVLVKKDEAKTKAAAYKMAKGLIETWNDNLSGNVWGYSIDNGTDSCWGFYGDYDNEKNGGALQAGREVVDGIVKDNTKKHIGQLRAYITNKVPLERREAFTA